MKSYHLINQKINDHEEKGAWPLSHQLPLQPPIGTSYWICTHSPTGVTFIVPTSDRQAYVQRGQDSLDFHRSQPCAGSSWAHGISPLSSSVIPWGCPAPGNRAKEPSKRAASSLLTMVVYKMGTGIEAGTRGCD